MKNSNLDMDINMDKMSAPIVLNIEHFLVSNKKNTWNGMAMHGNGYGHVDKMLL